MAKKFYSSYESLVASFFRQDTNEEYTRNSRMYYSGDTIFSYGAHFPIARIMPDGSVLFTTRTYSNTSSSHVNTVRCLARNRNIILCHNPLAMHNVNLGVWQSDVESLLTRLAAARKPELYTQKIAGIESQVHKYCSYFDIAIPKRLAALISIRSKDDMMAYHKLNRVAMLARELGNQNADDVFSHGLHIECETETELLTV